MQKGKIKTIGGALGAIATVSVACLGWANSISSTLAVHSASIDRMEIHLEKITDQYQRYDAQLSALIHKQDVRITLLESLVKQQMGTQEKNNGN